MLREQMVLATRDKHVLQLCPSGHRYTSTFSDGAMLHRNQSKHAQNMFDAFRSDVLCSLNPRPFWYEKTFFENISSVNMLRVYSDETATTLKTTAIVACPFHIVFLIFSRRSHRFLRNHQKTYLAPFVALTSEVCHEHVSG